MKKKIQFMMLITLLTTQMGGTVSGLVLLASEVESQTATEADEISEASSEEIESEEVESEEVESEEISEEVSEASSEAISDVESEAIESETSSVIESEVISEEESETDSEAEIDNVTAKITIDKDGGLEQQQAAVPQSLLLDTELEEDENITPYENELRLDADSGESTINVQLTSKSRSLSDELEDQLVYFTINDEGELETGSTKEPKSSDENVITVLNGTIVDSDSAIVRTNGGYDSTFYVYPSIDDLKSDTDGVPYSGGGFDGTFIESVEVDGKYYAHVKISGFEGYTEAGNIQIVPEELIQAQSYYTAEDGNWAYYSALDPVTSTEYDKMVVGSAPTSAEIGVKYYTNDDVNFYTDPILTDVEETDSKVSYNSYFMNLPFRSESNYTATNYKNYLKSKGYTDSEYYSETSAFVKAQTLENVNSLMIFAMANHESGYGRSTYARACYNFFGRAAIDSDPDQACRGIDYNTATDGIMAQTLFLQNGYFDILDWRYSGTHVGNKSSGMNVKYASDSDWGKKISNHAFMMDQYMGGKEEDKYSILKVSGVSHVYNDSGLTSKVKSSGDSGTYNFYDLSQMAGTSNTINVVALRQATGAYEIYPPTGIKASSSTKCSYTPSQRGSYPNYEGRSNVSVATNTANYSCDYGSFGSAKRWISKSKTSIINDVSVPYVSKNIYEYYPTGEVRYKFIVDSNTNVISHAYEYDKNKNIITKFMYESGTVYGENHGRKIRTRMNIKNNHPTVAIIYNSSLQITAYYEYYSDATMSNYGSKIKTRYNIDPKSGYITDAYGYTSDGSKSRTRIYQYTSGTTYQNKANRLKYKFEMTKGTTYITKAYRYDSHQNIDRAYEYNAKTNYGEQGSKTFKNVFYIRGSIPYIQYTDGYKNGQKYVKYTYEKGTIYGQGHGSRIKTKKYY